MQDRKADVSIQLALENAEQVCEALSIDRLELVPGIMPETIDGLINRLKELNEDTKRKKEAATQATRYRNEFANQLWKLIKQIRYAARSYYGEPSEMADKFGKNNFLFKKQEKYVKK